MRTEISQAKKDANFYIESVEKGKAFKAMEDRKRKHSDKVILGRNTVFMVNIIKK